MPRPATLTGHYLTGHYLRLSRGLAYPSGCLRIMWRGRRHVPAGSSFFLSSPPNLTGLAWRDSGAGVTVRRHPPGQRGSAAHRSRVAWVCRTGRAGHLAITPRSRSRASVLPVLGRAHIRREAGRRLRLRPNPLIPGGIALAARVSGAGVTRPALPAAARGHGAPRPRGA